MTNAAEAAAAKSTLAATLAAGVDEISRSQTVPFTLYKRVVLPLDGYVFWVNSGVSINAFTPNEAAPNTVVPNQSDLKTDQTNLTQIKGSLHYSTDVRQDENKSIAVNRVVFTALSQIDEFSEVAPDELWIGCFRGLKFAFSARGYFYKNADLYHYVGDAVYPQLETQLVENLSQLSTQQIVSNSLPIWLSMSNYTPAVYEVFGNPYPVYPSYLLPENLSPPYASVHIENTTALASTPSLGTTYQHDQLCSEKVRVTLYGLNNSAAMTFVDFVNQFITNQQSMGLMNAPVILDEKEVQTELLVIAQKKTVVYEVSYLQSQARNIARQLIESAQVQYSFQ